MPVFYEHSNIEERNEWIRPLNKLCWLKMHVILTFYVITIWRYPFVNFLSNFSSFQCLYTVTFEWDIVLSSSYDGWDMRGYTMRCPREGTSNLLNCVWLFLKVVQIQQTWKLWASTFKSWNCMKLKLLRKI